MTVNVTDAPARHRFEALIDGQLAGFAAYIRRDDVIVLSHTKVDTRFEGQGVGSALARAAVDDAAATGRRVRPECPFMAAWIDRHPAYKYLVEGGAPGGEGTA